MSMQNLHQQLRAAPGAKPQRDEVVAQLHQMDRTAVPADTKLPQALRGCAQAETGIGTEYGFSHRPLVAGDKKLVNARSEWNTAADSRLCGANEEIAFAQFDIVPRKRGQLTGPDAGRCDDGSGVVKVMVVALARSRERVFQHVSGNISGCRVQRRAFVHVSMES